MSDLDKILKKAQGPLWDHDQLEKPQVRVTDDEYEGEGSTHEVDNPKYREVRPLTQKDNDKAGPNSTPNSWGDGGWV